MSRIEAAWIIGWPLVFGAVVWLLWMRLNRHEDRLDRIDPPPGGGE